MEDKELENEISQLKQDAFSSDWERVKYSVDRLGKIGGSDIVDFLISLLSLNDSGIRNRAALALEEIKDNKAVDPLLTSIFKKENFNYNGTMVFALEALDCSKYLKEIFKILFYQGYEAKVSAQAILTNQKFYFTDQDIIEINQMWLECLQKPSLCPDFEDSKDDIQELVNLFLAGLKSKPSS
jgi:hypothetical protein